MITKNSGILKKLLLILPLTCLLILVISLDVFGGDRLINFVGNNQRLIGDFIMDSSSFNITPTDRIEFEDSDKEIVLEKDSEYFIEIIENDLNESFLTIQVIALSDRSEIEVIKENLENYGFTENRVVFEDNLYKLQSGKFESREEAEKFRKTLADSGFEGWIVGDVSAQYEVIVRDDSGNILYQGPDINLDDVEFYLGDTWLDGDFIIGQKEGKIKINYFIPIDMAVAGNIASLENSYNQEFNQEKLELLSIFLRTNLYGNIEEIFDRVSAGEIDFIRPDSRIIDSVMKTQDNYIFYDGGIAYQDDFYPTGYLSTLFNWFAADFNTELVVNDYNSEAEILNIMDYSRIETIVDARVQRGLNYKEIREETLKGNRNITVLELDLNRSNLKVRPFLANSTVSGLEDLVEIGRNNQALAGINGGFYEYSGRPLGVYMEDGKIVTGKVRDLVRSTLLIDEYGNIDIGIHDWNGNLSLEDGRNLMISGVNQVPEDGQAVIINKYYGESAPQLREGAVELVVNSNGKIVGINRSHFLSPSSIPVDGYIIQATGSKANILGGLRSGETISFENRFFPESELEGDIVHALGAGPKLIENGNINITSYKEGFQRDVVYGNAPRSAAGITGDNKLLLVTVDGRQPERSIGMTLEELADFMLDLGAEKAMNLDGGASARMMVRGFTMNVPSSERNIGNALLILPNM